MFYSLNNKYFFELIKYLIASFRKMCEFDEFLTVCGGRNGLILPCGSVGFADTIDPLTWTLFYEGHLVPRDGWIIEIVTDDHNFGLPRICFKMSQLYLSAFSMKFKFILAATVDHVLCGLNWVFEP